jgi:hypothetical protein
MKLKKLIASSLIVATIASSLPASTCQAAHSGLMYLGIIRNIEAEDALDEIAAKICKTSWAKAQSDDKMTNDKALTMTVTKADTATAEKLHKELIKGRKITLKIKGNKTNAKKIIKSLRNKIKKVNTYGVIFQYDSIKTSNGVTSVVIKKATAKDYNYACAFYKKLWTLTRYKYYYTYKYRNVNTFNNASEAEENLFFLIGGTENFCDLSDIVKVYLLFESGFFISGDYKYRNNTDFCVYRSMSDSDLEKYGTSSEPTLKSLLYNKYTNNYFKTLKAVKLLVQYLGVEKIQTDSYTPDNLASYFTIIQAKNSDGVLITVAVHNVSGSHTLVVNNENPNNIYAEDTSLEQESWDGYRKLATFMPEKPNWQISNFY